MLGECIDACMSDMTEPRGALAAHDVPHAESHFSSFRENAEMAKLPKFRFRRMALPAHTPARQCCCCSFDENLVVHSVSLFSHQEKEE
jgi:hypothetical protein